MNYAAWEQARQQALLQALLLGDRPQEAANRSPSSPPRNGRKALRRHGLPEKAETLSRAAEDFFETIPPEDGTASAGFLPAVPPAPDGAWEAVWEAARRRDRRASSRMAGPASVSQARTGLQPSPGGGTDFPFDGMDVPFDRTVFPLEEAGFSAAEPEFPSGASRPEASRFPGTSGPDAVSGPASNPAEDILFRTLPDGQTASAAGTGHGGPSVSGGTLAGQPAVSSAARWTPVPAAWSQASPGAETEARALSQAVQRDARRYDGGFPLY